MARIHDTSRFAMPPDLADMEAYAREAFATIPAELRIHVGDVVIQVEDFPDDEVLEEMECDSPFDLLGLQLVGRPKFGDELANRLRVAESFNSLL